MPHLCCGASYTTARYARFEFGRFRAVPTTDDIVSSIYWASHAKFPAIELEALTRAHFDSAFNRESITRIREVAEEEGLKIPQVYFPFISESFPSDIDRKSLGAVLSNCAESAKNLGANTLEMKSPPFPNTELFWDDSYPAGPPSRVIFHPGSNWNRIWEVYTTWVGELCDLVSTFGLKIAIEPRPREVTSNTDGMLMLLHSIKSSNLGVLFDTGHHFAMKEILPISIWKLGSRIFSVHLTDNDGVIEHQWAPGEGRIDWLSVLYALKNQNFEGYLTIESSGAGGKETDFMKARRMVEGLLKRSDHTTSID